MRHREQHRAARIGWLRASVLGANDGIVSTASLVVGLPAANSTRTEILRGGVASLVSGTCRTGLRSGGISNGRDSRDRYPLGTTVS
jgi:VIT1/CCC1 family predicted Fe2+/Mn2+ transporter